MSGIGSFDYSSLATPQPVNLGGGATVPLGMIEAPAGTSFGDFSAYSNPGLVGAAGGAGVGAGGVFGSGMSGTQFAGAALGGLQTLGGLYMGLKQLGLAKKQFSFEKSFSQANLANQMKTYNTALADRARSRAVMESQTPDQQSSYVRDNSLSAPKVLGG